MCREGITEEEREIKDMGSKACICREATTEEELCRKANKKEGMLKAMVGRHAGRNKVHGFIEEKIQPVLHHPSSSA